MKRTLVFAAIGEEATGAALLVVPSLVARLLLGVELTDGAVMLARVTGIALISLGLACWPGTPRGGMVFYGAAVAAYLVQVRLWDGQGGVLLWPAVLLHAAVTILLLRPDEDGAARKG